MRMRAIMIKIINNRNSTNHGTDNNVNRKNKALT